MTEYRSITAGELINRIAKDVDDLDSPVQVDIGATNNYKVIKGLQVRGGHLVIVIGERNGKAKDNPEKVSTTTK
jgi:hypothetical protein